MEQTQTKRIRVYGIVQGVGFRPTVSRHADEAGITGSVSNRGSYVEIIAQGTGEQISSFLDNLKRRPPKRSVILKIDVKDAGPDSQLMERFEIVESIKEKGEIFISPDIAICEDCRRELFDPSDRRYLHPFINCTSCGPRLTILDALPYDRKRTSMKEFPMCPVCEKEYYSPASRRYDAQPVCCNDCGPQVYLTGRPERGADAIRYVRRILSEGGIAAVKGIGGFHLCCDASDETAVRRLRELKRRPAKPFAVMMRDVAAVERECFLDEEQRRILTGYQKPILLLERRPGKAECAAAMAPEGTGLHSAGAPDGSDDRSAGRREMPRLCESAAPGNPKVGVMLPYAPVQMLLFDYPDDVHVPDMLIMTSGNVSGAPICRDDEEAVRELSGFCDCILSHDRKIRIRCDDSVMDFTKDGPYMIRRSRGYAPLPVLLSGEPGSAADAKTLRQTQGIHDSEQREDVRMRQPESGSGETDWIRTEPDRPLQQEISSVLAVGGELKNTFCIGKNALFYPSSYIGDLADVRSVRALRETIGRMETLLEIRPQAIACDLHPGYQSTALAQELARTYRENENTPVPLVPVQHHFAHIVSCMAENDYDGPVLGASFDGTGYGTDGTIWGGEILLADYTGFSRLGSIRPFRHVGGDIASREGWRIAVSMLHSLGMDGYIRDLQLCSEQEARAVCMMSDRGINTTVSTSAGRLFDAVSAVLGICGKSTFEGEASCSLQFKAEEWLKDHPETAPEDLQKKGSGENPENRGLTGSGEDRENRGLTGPGGSTDNWSDITGIRDMDGGRMILPTELLFARIAEEKAKGTDPGYLAWMFHDVLARQIAQALMEGSRRTGVKTFALSGGVYQNTLLLRRTAELLKGDGSRILTHHLVPPNDGGICLGQAVAAMAALRSADHSGGKPVQRA